MKVATKNLTSASLLLGACLLMGLPAQAAPMLFSGTDAGKLFANSEQAYADWSAQVGSHTLDNLEGLASSGPSALTSNLGNEFTATDDLIFTANFTFAVLQGIHLVLGKIGNETTFTWNIAEAVDSFGFFARGNDGGTVTIQLNNGASQQYSLSAASSNSNGDSLFWGVTDLDALVQSVTISTTDPDTGTSNTNKSNWDRFVYRSVDIPEPATLALFAISLSGLALFRRKPGIIKLKPGS